MKLDRTITTPVSFFKNIYQAEAVARQPNWLELIELFREMSLEPYEHKADAFLFAPCIFHDDRRNKQKVQTSNLIVLDIDGHATLSDIVTKIFIHQLESIVYTTASHSAACHKFRILIPLSQPVTASDWTATWFSANLSFGNCADTTKQGAESLFYVPGAYVGRPNRFHHFKGHIHDAAWWRTQFAVKPNPAEQNLPVKPPNERASARHLRHRKYQLNLSDYVGCPLRNHPLVNEKAVDDYLMTKSNWHAARYRFMCSVVGRAKLKNCPVTAADIVLLFNQLDAQDGGHYRDPKSQSDLLKDAEKAIENCS